MEALLNLLDRGRRAGYVTCAQIDALLPEDYEDGPKIRGILKELASSGVRILEEPRGPAARMEDANDPVAVYIRETCSVPGLTVERERALGARIHGMDGEADAARCELLEANLWIVVAIAESYSVEQHHMLELIQQGNICLMAAVRCFKPNRGYRFSTYATWLLNRRFSRLGRGAGH